MTENKAIRLSKLTREFNVGISTLTDFLKKKGHEVDQNPNTKVSPELYDILTKEFSSEISVKKESEKLSLKNFREKKESISINDLNQTEEAKDDFEDEQEEEVLIKDQTIRKPIEEETEKAKKPDVKVVGKIDLSALKKKKPTETAKSSAPEEKIIEQKKYEKIVEETPLIEVKSTEKEPVKEHIPEETSIIVEEKPSEEKPTIPENQVVEMETTQENHPENALAETDTVTENKEVIDLKVIGRIDLESMNQRTRPARKTREERDVERKQKGREKPVHLKAPEEKTHSAENTPKKQIIKSNEVVLPPEEQHDENHIKTKITKLAGPTVVGRIVLPVKEDRKKVASSSDAEFERNKAKKKRKRIKIDNQRVIKLKTDDKPKPESDDKGKKDAKKKKKPFKQEVNEEDVQKQIKDTLARLTSKGKSKGSRYRREKRDAVSLRHQEEVDRIEAEKNIIKVTEFVSVNELANMMDVPVTQIIATCMNLGLFVSINQRLDAETMAMVADEFGFKVEFVSVDLQEAIGDEEDDPSDLEPRSPIVTVMGHVDHGKTKLLDYIRNANVIGGEAGGITQHIGAYGVKLEDGRQITFLDTPGHEAFTAMRARGAQITDVAIIVVAADDGVMLQTVEAINHAQAAGVPLVFAINKIDKSTANPEKIKEGLANMNILVEDWGGKYQSQELSAKTGLHVQDLLEKVLLEAELLELKANPNRRATGTVIESSLDKGRGYVATILVQNGTLKIGDVVLAGTNYGHIKAMYNERGGRVMEAGPSSPVLILGLNGAPQAGDKFNVMEGDKEAREIANKREQLQREQSLRSQKHITLDEIGRRIAVGNFQELNIIVKGDVDGSVEALSDSLIKLSTEQILVNVIHKAVGQITESDVLLAAASNAIIIGFQVRPALSARKLAEKEEIDIRMYSIIYDAINELRDAMEGMLSPEVREEITATVDVREVFKITKVGTIAGCLVKEGKISKTNKVRVIRDGIVVFTGEIGALKRFKDEAKEVVSGLECGINITNFNDVKVGDIIEGFREFEVKKKMER